MKVKNNISIHHEGSDVSAVELTVPKEVLEAIELARETIKHNAFISNIEMDVWRHDFKVKQFDSTIDDDDAEEIDYASHGYFQSDVQYIKVFKSGRVVYRMYNKWDGSQFIEVPIIS
jgi:hypothetical protein